MTLISRISNPSRVFDGIGNSDSWIGLSQTKKAAGRGERKCRLPVLISSAKIRPTDIHPIYRFRHHPRACAL
jgi:hypothetical protein